MTDCARLYEVLGDGKPHSHHELYRLEMVVHSRISELRKRGHRIETWREMTPVFGRRKTTCWYRLVLSPDPSEPAHAARTARALPQDSLGSAERARDSSQGTAAGAVLDESRLQHEPLALFEMQERPSWA